MQKKVLIVGGTYFAGRVFSMVAAKQGVHLTFLNRGRYSMKSLADDVEEFHADRRDPQSLQTCGLMGDFDAVVDFCAYEPNDIYNIVQSLPIHIKQYIFLSSSDVYQRMPGIKKEDAPRQETPPCDPVGLYSYKKKILEDELIIASQAFGFSYTILRPAFIYGPYNYAPRESVYIKSLIKKEMIYQPTDAKGEFQMVYVKDLADAIIACTQQEIAKNKAYNLSAPEVMEYNSFLRLMEKVSGLKAEEIVPVTVEEVKEQRIPLPFPLTEEESERFDGSLICKELGISYTDIETGMKKTFEAFKPVYQ